jgi:hypothetical protein
MRRVEPPRHESQTYRGYQLEVKSLSVGWQVIITKDGAYVSNGNIKSDMKVALDEAHAIIDGLAEAIVAPV